MFKSFFLLFLLITPIYWNDPQILDTFLFVTSLQNQSIVKTIIALAKGLNMEVLAEGVETEDELEFLRVNGIDSIQGFYYHKPMPREEMETLLQR